MNLKWWQKTVVYQVYPKSFLDTTGSGQGDIPGITAKLDYLKTLGVGAVWLTPVYPSPMIDNGYDIADYKGIDPSYGTMADMEELLVRAKEKNIRIVMDLVYNHTSDKHPWFQASKQSRKNDKADWYIWHSAKADGSAPTNWRSIFGGSAWTWCEERRQYYLHTFAPQQPDLNWENPQVRQALYEAANFWLKKGVGGFRIDAIAYIKKPQEFINGEPDGGDGMVNIHKMTAAAPGIMDFLREFKAQVFSHHDIFTVAEANGVEPDDLPKWVGETGIFDMLFEFSHMNLEFPAGEIWYKAEGYSPEIIPRLKQCLSASQAATAANGWYPIFFENHDQPRCVRHFFPADAPRDITAKAVALLLFTLRGTPFVYQGQELGLDNVTWDNIADYDDISSRGQYDLALKSGCSPAEALAAVHRYSRDNARTPMQWGRGKEALFTSGTPWLPVHEDYVQCCVETEEREENSVLSFYRRISRLRRKGKAAAVLQGGSYQELWAERRDIFAFRRRLNGQETITLVNFTGEVAFYDETLLTDCELLSGNMDDTSPGRLRPYEAVCYYSAEKRGK